MALDPDAHLRFAFVEEASMDGHSGETLGVPERVIVSPGVGVFRPFPTEALISPGQPIGVIEGFRQSTVVRSPFGGVLMGVLAVAGERLRLGQAVAWLRSPDNPSLDSDLREATVSPTLLVVDDDEINRIMLTNLLEVSGCRAMTAADGQEALEILQGEDVDAILLDILMPRLDGFQVLEALKCDSHLSSIPVVVLSSVDEAESIIHCIHLGAKDFLFKPVDTTLLQSRLKACLARPA